MNLFNFRLTIASKLILLSTFFVTIMLIMGSYSLYRSATVFQSVTEVYETASLIEEVTSEIERPMNELRMVSLLMVIIPNQQSREKFNQERLNLMEDLDQKLLKWEKKTQFDQERQRTTFKNILIAWQQYKLLSNLTTESILKGHQESALINITGAGTQQFEVLHDQYQKWLKHKVEITKSIFDQANYNYQKQNQLTVAFVILMIFLVILINLTLLKRLSQPLRTVTNQLQFLAQGQLVTVGLPYLGNDEITEIIHSMQQLKDTMHNMISQANLIAAGNLSNIKITLSSTEDQLGQALLDMIDTLQRVIQQANAIAAGDYSYEIELRSEHDQLGSALRKMTEALRLAIAENVKQDWLKTGLAQLNDQLRGEQDVLILAKNTIDFLTTYLDMEVGLLYLLKEEIEGIYLQKVASYAYTDSNQSIAKFKIGEGLIGQAALEKRLLICNHTHEEYTYIMRSGLSKAVPRQVLIVPFLYEDKVLGVIELGSFNPLNDLQKEFLQQAMSNIGISMNSAESRGRMELLLQQTQQQARVLEEQQETLQTTNEELQTQSEELQTQQEELRHANDELEERTRELERQKNAIREKNDALEQVKQVIEAKAKELEIASRYKSEFLANMSHELRTPLNSLLILAQLLLENKDENLTEKQLIHLKTIHSAGGDLLTLINEVLDLSKIEAGHIEICKEEVEVSNLVEAIREKFQAIADNKNVIFQIDLTPQLPPVLYTDGQRLKQIINNLLSNAFKFTHTGSVNLSLNYRNANQLDANLLRKLPNQQGNFLIIAVTDTGIGIPKDKQQLIFEAFQQAEGTTNRRYGGTGLGLSISRQLARLLGGDILLDSQEKQGSTFTTYLRIDTRPAGTVTASPNTSANVPVSSHPVSFNLEPTTPFNSKIAEKSTTLSQFPDDRHNLQPQDKVLLIVEDDLRFLQTLVDLAQERNFKCIVAQDGNTGLQLVAEYKPDALILDIGLPLVDGWTVMQKLKDDPETRHIPVHFISAFDQDQDARKMGAIGCLLKPVGIAELSAAFKKITHFIVSPLRNLLIMVDNPVRRQEILELLENKEVKITFVTTEKELLDVLRTGELDCAVLDLECAQNMVLNALRQVCHEEKLTKTPMILYSDRELTELEMELLHECEKNLPIKSVRSAARLLDEATLFLHQVEAKLPKEKQKILQQVHDKSAILTDKKVLLVDDDVRNTFALMTVLDGKNMKVTVANHGKEALILLEDNPDIDIVLMDIMMPEMDGYETMRKIRSQPRFRNLPIIALTAKAMKGDKAKCIEAGASDYLPKPVDIDKLVSLMRVWLYR